MARAAATEFQEEEEEHHRNPFLSAVGASPSPASKFQFRKEASRARWDEETAMAEVTEKKGSMWTTTGVVRSGKLYCHIEEVLFLAERGALHLSSSDQTDVTIKDLYEKIASGEGGCSWESFEVYRHLKSLGYIVARHGTPWTAKTSDVEEELSASVKKLRVSDVKLDFDVYSPNSSFRKSSPGDPSLMVCVWRGRGSPPSRAEAEKLQGECNGVALKFCFVDHGRVCSFSFDRVVLPTLP